MTDCTSGGADGIVGAALTGAREMDTGGADLTMGMGGALRVTGAGATDMRLGVGPIFSFSSSGLNTKIFLHFMKQMINS